MLDRIDPFEDLELTAQEMAQFLDELAVVEAEANDPDERHVSRELRELAHTCRDDPGLMLTFLGD